MSSMRIDGKGQSYRILERLGKARPPRKILAGILVGRDKSSLSFLKEKERVARTLGVPFNLLRFPASAKEAAVEKGVRELARDPRVGGIIIELPLPGRYSRQRILDAVPREKDPDCLASRSLGHFYTGEGLIRPLAVEAAEEALQMVDYNLRGKRVLLIGSGILIGKPISLWLWLQNQVGELTIVNRGARNFAARLGEADVIISGAGRPHLFRAGDLKPGALVIDFGYGRLAGRVSGDFDPEEPLSARRRILYTPVPGGMGPLVIAKLFQNFYTLTAKARTPGKKLVEKFPIF